MKIQNRQIIDLFLSLKRLEGDKLQIAGDVRWKLAKNLRMSKTTCRDYDKAIVAAQQAAGTDNKALQSELETIQNIELEVPFLRVKLSELNLDTNTSINVPTLEGLMPIIDE